jgi:hypothetical protein
MEDRQTLGELVSSLDQVCPGLIAGFMFIFLYFVQPYSGGSQTSSLSSMFSDDRLILNDEIVIIFATVITAVSLFFFNKLLFCLGGAGVLMMTSVDLTYIITRIQMYPLNRYGFCSPLQGF